MASLEIRHPWTLCGLIAAFIDLALAYFLLCGSTFAFFASKFVGVVGLRLPCPCNGVFGFRSADFCWHRLLFDWPVRRIFDVQMLVKSRFPLDLIWFETDHNSHNGNRVVEVEGEACSSSFSCPRNQNLVDRESGCDVKGKRLMIPKQRSGIRRRRRATLAIGKFATVFPSDSFPSVARTRPSSCDCRENEYKFGEGLCRLSGKEDEARDNVYRPSGEDEGTYHSLELSGSFAESNDTANHSVSVEKYVNETVEERSIVGSDSDTFRSLEQALAEEKAACAALYLELEKERAAAATAADEAMAMISRLQKDKASMEIETRQYERMIEEKFAYDEEEIDILKEILVRRERENHFLEKEIETYRRMSIAGDQQSNDDISDTLDEWGQRPLSSPYSSTDPPLVLHNTMPRHNNVEHDVDFSSEVPFVEKQSQSDGYDLVEKTVILVDPVDCLKLNPMPENMNGSDHVDES